MDARITKIICPSCEGTGKFSPVMDVNCMWCKGAKRLPVADAKRYADTVWMCAGGGYIAGDHDYADKTRMEKRAADVYALTGDPAPWATRP